MSPASRTIRQLRDQASLTPADVERLTEGRVKKGALNMIEQGKVPHPRSDTLGALAAALGITMEACQAAIAATVAARQTGTLPPGPPGRPKAGARNLQAALESARQVVAALEEQLATRGA